MSLAKVFGLLLMVVCFIALHTDAVYEKRIEDDYPEVDEIDSAGIIEGDEEDLPGKEIKFEHLLAAIAALSVETVVPTGKGMAQQCICTGLTCTCCQIKNLTSVGSCLVVTYIPTDKTATVSLTFSGKTAYKKKFPLYDPPEICYEVCSTKFCLALYDFKVDSKKFTGCARMSAYFIAKLGTYDLGCIEIKLPTPGPAKLLRLPRLSTSPSPRPGPSPLQSPRPSPSPRQSPSPMPMGNW